MNKEKLKSVLTYQVPPKVVNAVFLFFLLFFSIFLFLWNIEIVPVWTGGFYVFLDWCGTTCFWYSIITLAILWTFFYFLTGRLLVSYVMMEILTVIWGFANRVVYYTRNRYVSIKEFNVLVEAKEVKVNMNVGFHPVMITLLIICVILGILLYIVSKRMRKDHTTKLGKKVSWSIRILGSIVLILLFVGIHTNPPKVVEDNMFPYKETGTVVWFCQSLFDNVTKIISEEEVLTIYNEYIEMGYEKEVVSNKRPNVIVVMSEAFWDVSNLEGIVEVDNNPMDKFYELAQGNVFGEVAVNIYGGGTNYSEFEFLTGINSQYLIDANCYKAYYSKEQGSMVSYMKELGYYAMALHSYDGEFWHRKDGYKNMGFDVFYDANLFDNTEKSHGYISDESLTKEIIQRFEEQKQKNPEQPVFSFAVSVQNHVSDLDDFNEYYKSVDYSGTNTNVTGSETKDVDRADVEEYYNGLHESIDALQALIEYFTDCEEDTIVVFFGDHAPSFVNILHDDIGKEMDNSAYRTPYMIWTNYENDYESYGEFNLCYLSSVLIEYLNFPKPQQYYMNKYMLENCGINTAYEPSYSENMNAKRKLDMMNLVYYICETFPEKENALPNWQIVK